MLKKGFIVGCSLFSALAFAQNTPAAAKVIVYKWHESGVTHYSTQPPHGINDVVRLDERGLVITDASEDQAAFEAMRPVRPEPTQKPAGTDQQEEALPEGAISKAERCKNAQHEIEVIESVPTGEQLTIEDEEGNLLPVSDEEKQTRLQRAKSLVERLCEN